MLNAASNKAGYGISSRSLSCFRDLRDATYNQQGQNPRWKRSETKKTNKQTNKKQTNKKNKQKNKQKNNCNCAVSYGPALCSLVKLRLAVHPLSFLKTIAGNDLVCYLTLMMIQTKCTPIPTV